ncbi:MAG TPA: DUF3540 domain-containing protein [Polyangium sp.]|nr:DUF3540 domain-containing protein [Polyangium sp.]
MSNLAHDNLAENLAPPAPESGVSRAENRDSRNEVDLRKGTVIFAANKTLEVRVGDETVSATRAVSCLVAPIAGDVVLVAMPAGECYVLAVLQREEGADCKIAVDGNLEIKAPNGKVAVSSGEGIELLTAKETNIISSDVSVHATSATMAVDRLSYLGAMVHAEVNKLRVVAAEVDGFFERTLARVKRSYKFVEEIEQVRAKQIDMKAETSVRVHSESTVITADGLCKLDGEQIHIG